MAACTLLGRHITFRQLGVVRLSDSLILQPSVSFGPWRRLSNEAGNDDEKGSVEDTGSPRDKSSDTAAETPSLANLLSGMKTVNQSTRAPEKSFLSLKLAKPQLRRKTPKSMEASKNVVKDQKAEVKLDEKLLSATRAVAVELRDDPDRTESELLKKLREHAVETEQGRVGHRAKKSAVGDIFVGMKIDRSKPKPGASVAPTSSFVDRAGTVAEEAFARATYPADCAMPPAFRRESSSRMQEKVDLFGSQPLGIFKPKEKEDISDSVTSDVPVLATWDALQRKQLHLIVSVPPRNALEETIQWTEQGKLWPLPIDNEYGLDEEAKISFYEHVHLDHLLEDGFPSKGPIRHFMELVVTGLSKNPYITVERKKEHVAWYRQYFKEKESILREMGALPAS